VLLLQQQDTAAGTIVGIEGVVSVACPD